MIAETFGEQGTLYIMSDAAPDPTARYTNLEVPLPASGIESQKGSAHGQKNEFCAAQIAQSSYPAAW